VCHLEFTEQGSIVVVVQYTARIISIILVLDKVIDQNVGTPSYLSDLIYWYTFVLAGTFGFGIDFSFMNNKKPNDGLLHMRSALTLLVPFNPTIRISRLGFAFIAGLWKVQHWLNMLKISDKCI
jgi:hypothetical protein